MERRFSIRSYALLISSVALCGSCREDSPARRGDAAIDLRAQIAPQGAAPDSRAPSSPSLDCFEQARDEATMSESDALLLCRGAVSSAPLQCFSRAQDETFLADREIFELCRCAGSTEPVDCYTKAQEDTFLPQRRIIELCGAVVTNNLYANCAPVVGFPR